MIIKRRAMGYLLIPLCYLLLSACGGGDGDTAAAAVTPTNTDCVLDTAKIGDCTL